MRTSSGSEGSPRSRRREYLPSTSRQRSTSLAGAQSCEDPGPLAGASPAGEIDLEAKIKDVRPLDAAGEGDLSFLDNPKYLPLFTHTGATACLVAPKFASQAPAGTAALGAAVLASGRIASLYVNDYNTVARATYARIGFDQVGVFATVLMD